MKSSGWGCRPHHFVHKTGPGKPLLPGMHEDGEIYNELHGETSPKILLTALQRMDSKYEFRRSEWDGHATTGNDGSCEWRHLWWDKCDDTASQRQNSKPGGLRSSTLPIDHIGFSQYWLFTSERGRNFLFLWNLNATAVDGRAIFLVEAGSFNPLTAKLFNLNFQPLEVVSRWRDPQLQVSENYSDLT